MSNCLISTADDACTALDTTSESQWVWKIINNTWSVLHFTTIIFMFVKLPEPSGLVDKHVCWDVGWCDCTLFFYLNPPCIWLGSCMFWEVEWATIGSSFFCTLLSFLFSSRTTTLGWISVAFIFHSFAGILCFLVFWANLYFSCCMWLG